MPFPGYILDEHYTARCKSYFLAFRNLDFPVPADHYYILPVSYWVPIRNVPGDVRRTCIWLTAIGLDASMDPAPAAFFRESVLFPFVRFAPDRQFP